MRVLIVGGYGVFGGRLAKLLLADGVGVIVAGPSLAKAKAFADAFGGTALEVDLRGDLTPIAEAAPSIVVDAAGPFQAYAPGSYRLARFCVAHRIHYLDFSDDAAFTAGIAELDAVAVEAGRFTLSGVSSLPAISAAAVRQLATGYPGFP